MAKEKMVTRTTKITEANILCLDTESAEPFNKTVELVGEYKDDDAILEASRKVIDNEKDSAVRVVGAIVKEVRYGMLESVFIANSVILPNLTERTNNN